MVVHRITYGADSFIKTILSFVENIVIKLITMFQFDIKTSYLFLLSFAKNQQIKLIFRYGTKFGIIVFSFI